jgi:hypothetical protein
MANVAGTFDDEYIIVRCDKLTTPKKNPIGDRAYWSLYLDTATILLVILSDRIRDAEKRRNTIPHEIDPATWADL